jgi:hypothetical protein
MVSRETRQAKAACRSPWSQKADRLQLAQCEIRTIMGARNRYTGVLEKETETAMTDKELAILGLVLMTECVLGLAFLWMMFP